MKITAEHIEQVSPMARDPWLFRKYYPNGLEPTIENLATAHSDYSINFCLLFKLLPKEGPWSSRACAVWCIEELFSNMNRRFKHSQSDSYLFFRRCLNLIRQRTDNPDAVSDKKFDNMRQRIRNNFNIRHNYYCPDSPFKYPLAKTIAHLLLEASSASIDYGIFMYILQIIARSEKYYIYHNGYYPFLGMQLAMLSKMLMEA